jgi:glucose/arabinose dehydrogenase
MRKISIILLGIVFILTGGFILFERYITFDESTEDVVVIDTDDQNEVSGEVQEPQIVVADLSIPWDIAFLPEGGMLVTERGGRLVHIGVRGEQKTVSVPNVHARGEGGLLGLELHPNFDTNKYLYIYRTSTLSGASINEVVRYRYATDKLTDETVILGDIDGALFHNGGRLRFGPPRACKEGRADCYFYVAIGDAQNPSQAQKTGSLSGKILRVHDDGTPAEGNPFESEVYSYGHRNPQGLTWDAQGNLWSTEHGRSGASSGLDELNSIQRGGNYGWPDSQGDTVLPGTIKPERHSGADVTWAPADALYWDGGIFFPGLKGETLYEAVLNDAEDAVVEMREHFIHEYGRLRTVVLGPDGMLYLTTSNRDGRGTVREGDDKIIKVDPRMFRQL